MNPPSTQSVCPTCGSGNPRLVNAPNRAGRPSRFLWFDASILSDDRRAHWHCPDPFHSPDTQTEERCGHKTLRNVPCEICGDDEPHHVHDGDKRIEDYFTIGRGQTDFEATLSWRRKAASLRSQLDQAERRVEEAEADAAEANHQANMMSRNLQAVNALAASTLAKWTADTARSLLNPSSTSEGDA